MDDEPRLTPAAVAWALLAVGLVLALIVAAPLCSRVDPQIEQPGRLPGPPLGQEVGARDFPRIFDLGG